MEMISSLLVLLFLIDYYTHTGRNFYFKSLLYFDLHLHRTHARYDRSENYAG